MNAISTECSDRSEVDEKVELEQDADRHAVHHAGDEEMPRVRLTRRQIAAFAAFVLLVVGFLYFVLPDLTGVGETVHHIEGGDKWWIAVGVVLEMLSFAGPLAM